MPLAGLLRQPAVYRSIEPAWNDKNLREITGSVHSHLYFADVRRDLALAVDPSLFSSILGTTGSEVLFHSVDVSTFRQMYPEHTDVDVLGQQARIVVSEPLTDLQGAFREVPESSVAVLSPEGLDHRPFTPVG